MSSRSPAASIVEVPAGRRAAAAAIIVILLAAVVFVPVPGRGQWLKVFQDFGHAPAFGCIAVVVVFWLRWTRPAMPAGSQYLVAFVIAVALGVATELVQFVVKRDPSWTDVRSDVYGATAFLGAVAAFDTRFSNGLRIVGTAVAIVLLVLHSIPLATMIRAYALRESMFPVLAEFQDPRSGYFFHGQNALTSLEALPEQYGNEKALRVQFLAGDWPGIDLYEPSPDWRGYHSLALDIVNPTDDPLGLTVRAHDAHHNKQFEDRFNRRFEVAPRTRAMIRMPITEIAAAPHGRQMDLQRMQNVLVFRNAGSRAAEMYLVAIRLER